MKRITPQYALVTENWFTINAGLSFLTGGIRLMGEKENWDFGLLNLRTSKTFTRNASATGLLPFISYMRNF